MHVSLLERVPKRGSERRRILNFIHGLRNAPYTAGDFTDRDETLRTREIKIVGDYAITYWVDTPVKTVMIVDVRPANK